MKKQEKNQGKLHFSQIERIVQDKRALVDIENKQDKFSEVREAQKLLESEREKLEMLLRKYK